MKRYHDETYRMLVEETGTAIFECDLKNSSFECSDSFYKYAMSDIDMSTILSNDGPLDFVYPDDHPALFKFFDDTGKLPKAETTIRLKMKDGSFRWSRMSGFFAKDDDGNKTHVIGLITDIDDEKQKAVMTESLLDAIPGGIAIFRVNQTDPILECQYFSDGFAKMSGRTRKEVEALLKKGVPMERVVIPADRGRFLSTWTEKAAEGKPINIVYRCTSVKGDIYWSHLSATEIRKDNGCPLYYAVFTPPSDEVLLYRELVEGSTTATFVAEKKARRILYVNPAWRTLEEVGINDQVIGKNLYEIISDDQRLLTKEQVETLPSDSFYTFHMKRSNGVYLLIHARSIVWNGADAYILYIIDETAQCIQQEQLESSRALLDAAMTNADVSAWELDTEKREIIQTSLSQKVHGFASIVPNIPEVLFEDGYTSPQTEDEVRRLYDEVYSGKPAQADVQFRLPAADGYSWERLIYKPVFDSDGKLIKAIGTSLNINEQMARRSHYDEQMKLFRAIANNTIATMYVDLTHNKFTDAQSGVPAVKKAMRTGDPDTVYHAVSMLIPEGKERDEFNSIFNNEAMLETYRSGKINRSICHRISSMPGWFESFYDLIYNPVTSSVEAICILRDVSTEKQAEQIVNTLVDVNYDAVFTVDVKSGKTDPVMATAQKFKNVEDCPATIEESLRIYCPGADDVDRVLKENSIPHIQEQLEHSNVYTTEYFVLAEGRILRKHAVYSYLGDDRRTILGAVQDFTESYRIEEQRQQMLKNALTEAKNASTAKSDFLSNMSHEIRTPMNAIIGMTKLAESAVAEDDASTSEYLRQIDYASEYLLGLLNDILDMSRIESSKFTLNCEWTDCREALASCVNMIEPQMEEKNITFKHPLLDNITGDVEQYIDALRVKQIMMNLLNNAWKFTPEGGHVTLSIQNISFTDHHATDSIVVRDDGCGMSSDFLDHVFEPFSQERNRFTGKVQGTGLGLPLTKKIVEAMNGTIKIESAPNEGTVVTVTLPYEYRTGRSQAVGSAGSQTIDETILAGKRVLLCEDHPLNSTIAQKLLEKKKMTVDCAVDGREGLEKYLSMPEYTYDAILMDIRMPVMDGLEATRRIRAQSRKDAKTIPIIAMTANAFEEDHNASREAGMNSHLSKPIQLDELYATLAELISKNQL